MANTPNDFSSLGGNLTSNIGQKKIQQIQLTFQDQVLKNKLKNSTFKKKYFPWVRIDELKKDIAKNRFNDKVPWDQLRLFCKNIELDNNKRFFDNNVEEDNDIIIKKFQNIETPLNGIINPYQIFKIIPKQIINLIMAVQSGLNAGRKPKLSQQGTSGTYFLQNHQKKKIAIFKPHDQQPFTPSNPRGYIGNLGCNGIRKGILSGQAATRQVAAYLLDTNNFHKVPPTTYVEFYHPSFNYKQFVSSTPIVSQTTNDLKTDLKTLKTKHGSLQQFVQSHDVAGNLGAHQFDVQQVHKIGILDIRILNCDRNQANILVKKLNIIDQVTKKQSKKVSMTPIDHGLSFPDNFQIYEYQMVWMSYPQANAPFSQKSLQFINNIDPDEDCRTLRQKLGFREICLRNFKIAQIFLKRLTKQGFKLRQIGSKMYRKDDSDSDSDSQQQKTDKVKKQNKSDLQKLVQRAEQIYNLVKQNGIRSTVQFQIGLIKMRREKQESITYLQQKKIQSIKMNQIPEQKQQNQNDKPDEQISNLKKKSSQISNNNSIEVGALNNSKSFVQQKKIKKIKQNQTSLEKMESIQSLKTSIPKVRNVSLPNLASNHTKKPRRTKKKQKVDEQNNPKKNKWKKNQKWDEVFFHYFEDLLQQYIKTAKIKQKNRFTASLQKPNQRRGRFNSQSIDLDQIS